MPGWEEPYRPDPLGLLDGTEDLPDLLGPLVDFIKARRARNQDTYIAVTGREGDGKSALGLTAALAIQPDLDPEDVILTQKDYQRVYDPTAQEKTYVFDEAGRLFFNRNWNRKDQKDLIMEVMENRQNRNTVFLHLPQFKVLDKYVREGRVPVWFACKRQGVAMVRKLVYNAYEEEAYYPIVVDDHYWDPLEETHPDFAEVYYRRKAEAHRRTFEAREDDLGDLDEAYKTARRHAIMQDK